jgi:hypothetical protein
MVYPPMVPVYTPCKIMTEINLVMLWGICIFVMLLVQGYTWTHLTYVLRGGASVLQPALSLFHLQPR